MAVAGLAAVLVVVAGLPLAAGANSTTTTVKKTTTTTLVTKKAPDTSASGGSQAGTQPPSKPTTTKPTTTKPPSKPPTTKPASTTKPATTKPATPTTTEPATTPMARPETTTTTPPETTTTFAGTSPGQLPTPLRPHDGSNTTVTVSTWYQGVAFAGDKVFSGYTLQYRFSITNSGTAAGQKMTIKDHVSTDATYVTGSASCGTVPSCAAAYAYPFVTFTLSTVAAGASGLVVSYEVTPKEGAIYQHIGTRASFVGGSCSSTCYTNKVGNQVLPRPVSVSSQTGSGTDVSPGQSITYLIQVKNILGTPATNVVVNNSVPAQTTLIPGSASCRNIAGCTVSTTASTVTYTFATVPPHAGNKLFVSFNATVNAGATGTIPDTALWSGGICAVAPCNTNVVDNVVGSVVSVTKSASSTTVQAGSKLTYTITVINQGGSGSGQVVLFDTAPPGSTYSSGSANCGGIANCVVTVSPQGVIQFSIPNVAAGATANVTFAVVPATGVTSLSNTASWTGNGCTEPNGCVTNTVATPVSPSRGGGGGTTTTSVPGGTGPGSGGKGKGQLTGQSGVTPSGVAPSGPSSLVFTGAWIAAEVGVAAGLLALGTVLLGLTRRSRRRRTVVESS